MSEWTTEMVYELRRSWGCAPAREIAERLGVSRSAVIGKANRIGLSQHRETTKVKPAPPPRAPAPKPVPATCRRRKPPATWGPYRSALVERGAGSAADAVAKVAKAAQLARGRICAWSAWRSDSGRRCCDAVARPGTMWCPRHEARVTALKEGA